MLALDLFFGGSMGDTPDSSHSDTVSLTLLVLLDVLPKDVGGRGGRLFTDTSEQSLHLLGRMMLIDFS